MLAKVARAQADAAPPVKPSMRGSITLLQGYKKAPDYLASWTMPESGKTKQGTHYLLWRRGVLNALKNERHDKKKRISSSRAHFTSLPIENVLKSIVHYLKRIAMYLNKVYPFQAGVNLLLTYPKTINPVSVSSRNAFCTS